jgi:hypothetical protein
MGARVSRRAFLERAVCAGAALQAGLLGPAAAEAAPTDRASLPSLERLYPDLDRHFIFEYYPWYSGPPEYLHWNYLDRVPPNDLSSVYMPRLGAYDVRSPAVIEQHARWIRETGVGAVALSWWGHDNFMDAAVPLIMDVMKDYDLKVTFALEPYAPDRGRRFADDVLYLLDRFGEKRSFDAFLLPRDASGRQGPVFKGFACILLESTTDCRGQVHRNPNYTPDAVWREQTDRLRLTLRGEFDHLTLLADSLEFARTPASGFDGIGIYDNFIGPDRYLPLARGASEAGLVFSFNVNPGYAQVEPRLPPTVPDRPDIDPTDPCYVPRDTAAVGGASDWSKAEARERAARASTERIRDSFRATLDAQMDPSLENRERGFFLVYINSWNEWHEGHAFEPMRDAADLTPAERANGYRNPENGSYRLETLRDLMRGVRSARAERPDRPPASPRRAN